MKIPRSTVRVLTLAALLVILSAIAYAQFRFPGRGRGIRVRYATPQSFDGTFHFCRLMFQSDRYEPGGSGWDTDYPGADMNFSIRLSELTKTWVGMDHSHQPQFLVVRLPGDDTLFQCPFVTMEDAGTAGLDPEAVQQLRKYLLKGGFVWADDFWGTAAWFQWQEQIGKVLPPDRYPIVDIPIAHAMFHTLFNVGHVPQVPSIQSWRRLGGGTSERGADSADVHVRGIFDERGRLMVLMTHNTDISDTWEREGEDPEYFYRFSPDGYAVAIDVMLYAMSH